MKRKELSYFASSGTMPIWELSLQKKPWYFDQIWWVYSMMFLQMLYF